MISVIQLVTHGSVTVNEKIIGAIERGIVALVGIEKTDTEKDVEKLFNKIIHYRLFPDAAGKTNLGLKEVQGGLLLVSQFTLVAETAKGLRPGFSKGMAPERGRELFDYLVDYAHKNYPLVASGQYGANMQINLCNDGPMTFILNS